MTFPLVVTDPCGAKTRSREGTCKNPKVRGGKRCRMHGGAGLVGPLNPNWKGGRHTTRLPQRLLEVAAEADSDKELHSLRETIIVTDARLSDLLVRVDSGESGAMWRKLREALKEYEKAETIKDPEGKVYWWGEIHSLITFGANDYDAWDEVHAVVDRLTKLKAQERKRIIDAHMVISAQEVVTMFSALLAVVDEHVVDREIMSRISRDGSRILRGIAG